MHNAARAWTSLSLALLLFAVALALQAPFDPDLGWHLRVGQDLWAGRFPFQDDYTWSMPGYAWVDHEWLTNAGMDVVYRAAGAWGIGLIYAAVALSAFVVAARTGAFIGARLSALSAPAGGILGAALMVAAMLASANVISARAQMITLLGFAVVNHLIWRFLAGDRARVWVLPTVIWVWANLHGGFIIGLLLLGLTLACLALARWIPGLRAAFPFSLTAEGDRSRQLRSLFAVAVASGLASLANPYTWRVYEEALRVSADAYARARIVEWLPVNFQSLTGLALGAFVFVLLWWLLWTRAYHSAWHLLLLPVFLYVGLSSSRNSALLALFALPWFIAAVGSHPAARRWLELAVSLFALRRGSWLYYGYNGLLAALAAGVLLYRIVLFASYSLDPSMLAERHGLPERAVAFLQAQARPEDRLFNDYDWGGYLIWRLPEHKVYIDGRMASWREGDRHIFREYNRIAGLAPGWLELLQANRVSLVLTRKDSPLAAGLALAPSFQRIYMDEVSAIYRRTADS
jgi:hypothetical protein